MNQHIEAAAAAYNNHPSVKGGYDYPCDKDCLQSAITAYLKSLASAGEEGVVEAAAAPFMHFLDMIEAKPMRGAAEEFYAIHVGTEWEARLSLTQFRELRAALAVARASMGEDSCAWECEDDEGDSWFTSCGHGWTFNDGGPAENHMTYCHGCGKRIDTARAKESP